MWFFATLIFIIIAILINKFEREKPKLPEESKLPYVRKNWFLTKAETEFFKILEQAIANRYYIFPQVRIIDLLLVKGAGKNRYKYRNKIDRKSVDFVIVGKNNLNPLLAIELDDSSHNYSGRMDRDNFVEKIFKDAGLPLLRVDFRKSYNVPELSSLIYNILYKPEESKAENGKNE
jgi:very-short-patch-repair endonuclease